jgi:hypothetical protein
MLNFAFTEFYEVRSSLASQRYAMVGMRPPPFQWYAPTA